jgi:CPA1 family monovalent cation:H+ antiporter
VVALVPNGPQLDLPPELILALLVAPVLLDAAYDTSWRDLRRNWRPVSWLVVVAVGLTTTAVAWVARLLVPGLTWPAAITLGALLSPPDAVAALAVLAQVNPPHRIRKVLEGESLLNDATALLLYKLAIGAVATGSFHAAEVVPTFVLVVFGSVLAGWLFAYVPMALLRRVEDAPTAAILQFGTTFAAWLLAERLGLSSVVTIVVLGLTSGQRTSSPLTARVRVSTFAIWESVTMVLNILAFTLIGLQIRPIVEGLDAPERWHAFGAALAILAVVIVVRFVWVLIYHALARLLPRAFGPPAASSSPPTVKGALVAGWCGMRGIVTLAAALALPGDFPHREFMLLTAFVVVLGTLVVQGLTLRPLLVWLALPGDAVIENEISLARRVALDAALAALRRDGSADARALEIEYRDALEHARRGSDPHETQANVLRRRVVPVARRALDELRSAETIGDDAYRRVEEELDWLELSAQPLASPRRPG